MSRWGIKGVEDLGNGYSVGFTLEQGFLADSGAEHTSGLAFSRESLMRTGRTHQKLSNEPRYRSPFIGDLTRGTF